MSSQSVKYRGKKVANEVREAGRGQIMKDLKGHDKEFKICPMRVGNLAGLSREKVSAHVCFEKIIGLPCREYPIGVRE